MNPGKRADALRLLSTPGVTVAHVAARLGVTPAEVAEVLAVGQLSERRRQAHVVYSAHSLSPHSRREAELNLAEAVQHGADDDALAARARDLAPFITDTRS